MTNEEIKRMFMGVEYVVVTEKLSPVGSNDVAPPTFAGEVGKKEPVFNTFETNEGMSTFIDTVQKEVRRMIELISEKYLELLPENKILLDDSVDSYYKISHRITDAVTNGTEFRKYIEDNILTDSGINYHLLALLDPLSILFGFWDSRGTLLKQKRLICSEIIASDTKIITENTTFTPFKEFTKKDGKSDGIDYADVGLSPVPKKKINSRVHIDGGIERITKLRVKDLFTIINKNIPDSEKDLIGSYLFLLGLTFVTLPLIQNNGGLRSGCDLKVVDRKVTTVSYDDEGISVTKEIKLDHKQVMDMTKEISEKIEFKNMEIKQTTENIRKVAKEKAELKRKIKK